MNDLRLWVRRYALTSQRLPPGLFKNSGNRSTNNCDCVDPMSLLNASICNVAWDDDWQASTAAMARDSLYFRSDQQAG